MSEFDEYQRRRWTRENANLYIRHDAHRYMAPGAPFFVGHDVVKYGWPHAADEPQPSKHDAELLQRPDVTADLEFEAELRRLRCDIASMRLDWELAKLAWRACKYNPDQPRVPAGNSDGGQWTSEGAQGASPRVRLAVADKPRLGPAAIATIAFEAAKKAIEAYRKDNLFVDLFQSRIGTVSYTELNGEEIFGSNSTSPTYTSHDRAAATALRDALVERYPEAMKLLLCLEQRMPTVVL